MPSQADVLAPPRYRVLSGSALKVIAVITMLIDHVAVHLLASNPTYLKVYAHFETFDLTPYWILRSIGRIAFPIFCFLLVEGFVHTRNRFLYGRNLLLFALVSEVPFDMARRVMVVDITYQNVFFTLFLGYLGLCALDGLRGRRGLQTAALVGLAIVAKGLLCDYGALGYGFILAMYVTRNNAPLMTAFGCCLTSAAWRAGLAFIPINFYNGKRGFIKGPVLKFAFYAFYPVHLLAIWWVRTHIGI